MDKQNEKKKGTWGGKRDGAGRRSDEPKTRSIGIRVPSDVAEILDRQEHRTAFIIEAIRAYDRERRMRDGEEQG